jgi:hypothetical protein
VSSLAEEFAAALANRTKHTNVETAVETTFLIIIQNKPEIITRILKRSDTVNALNATHLRIVHDELQFFKDSRLNEPAPACVHVHKTFPYKLCALEDKVCFQCVVELASSQSLTDEVTSVPIRFKSADGVQTYTPSKCLLSPKLEIPGEDLHYVCYVITCACGKQYIGKAKKLKHSSAINYYCKSQLYVNKHIRSCAAPFDIDPFYQAPFQDSTGRNLTDEERYEDITKMEIQFIQRFQPELNKQMYATNKETPHIPTDAEIQQWFLDHYSLATSKPNLIPVKDIFEASAELVKDLCKTDRLPYNFKRVKNALLQNTDIKNKYYARTRVLNRIRVNVDSILCTVRTDSA